MNVIKGIRLVAKCENFALRGRSWACVILTARNKSLVMYPTTPTAPTQITEKISALSHHRILRPPLPWHDRVRPTLLSDVAVAAELTSHTAALTVVAKFIHPMGTDVVPLLVHACSGRCVDALPRQQLAISRRCHTAGLVC